MTTEDKFKELLNIACENGFDKSKFFYNNDYNHIAEIDKKFIHCDSGFNPCSYSLNDLVLQTNFFDCLFKSTAYSTMDFDWLMFRLFDNEEHIKFSEKEKATKIQLLKFKWILEVEKGNGLGWLFKQFNL